MESQRSAFCGMEIYHVKGSPVDPNRIYASQTSAWFGQIIQRSDDGGKKWDTPGSSPEDLKSPDGTSKGESNKFVYDGVPGTHQWYDGTQHPWSSSAFGIWSRHCMIPSMFTPGSKTRRCLNRRTAANRGTELSGLRKHDTARNGNRAQAACVCIQFSSIRKIHYGYTWRSRPQARSAQMTAEKNVETDQSRVAFRIYSGSSCRGRPLRSSHRAAFIAPQYIIHAKTLGRDAER